MMGTRPWNTHIYTLEHAYIHYDDMPNDVDFIMMSIL